METVQVKKAKSTKKLLTPAEFFKEQAKAVKAFEAKLMPVVDDILTAIGTELSDQLARTVTETNSVSFNLNINNFLYSKSTEELDFIIKEVITTLENNGYKKIEIFRDAQVEGEPYFVCFVIEKE